MKLLMLIGFIIFTCFFPIVTAVLVGIAAFCAICCGISSVADRIANDLFDSF